MNGIRFMLLLKYLIARKDFSNAFKPYDIKDILEQYAAGHSDILSTVKHMDHRLDKIQAIADIVVKLQNKSKFNLNTRLSKVENYLEDSEIILKKLMRAQFENKLLLEQIFKLFLSNHKNETKSVINLESIQPNIKRRRISL